MIGKRAFLVLAFVVLAAGALWGARVLSTASGAPVVGDLQGLKQELSHSRLEVVTARGAESFDVEEALTPEQQERGLMLRKSLPRDAGMLFVFRPAQPVSFWMKDTYIPLDMIFIGENGRVLKIVKSTKPLDITPIVSGAPVASVFEINGGEAERRGVVVGDKVNYAR
jgi:uncharacterized protein